MLSVSTDAEGWTRITPPADARVIYVSNSQGRDSNDGLSPDEPIKSIAAGSAMLRDGSGDQLLLKRGDTWRETLGTFAKSGRSASDPMVIGAYGQGARPTLATGASTAVTFGKGSHPRVDHLALVGVRFYADTRDPDSPTYSGPAGREGVRFPSASTDILIEDCVVQGYTTNVVLGRYFGALSDITVRRSSIIDAYSTSGYSQGLYATDVHGLTLEENVFDHNGWNERVKGAVATATNHNIYLRDDTSDVVVRGNLIANASGYGLQARSGGIIKENTFLNNPVGMTFGLVNGSPGKPGGVTGAVRDNVFLGGGDINGSDRGTAIDLGNVKSADVSGNVFAHNSRRGSAIALSFGNGVTNPSQVTGINNLSIHDNIVYDWSRGLTIMKGFQPGVDGEKGVNNLRIRDNDFQRLTQAFVLHAGAEFAPGQEIFSGNRYDVLDSAGNVPYVSSEKRSIKWIDWMVGRESGGSVEEVNYADPNQTAASYARLAGLQASDDRFVIANRGQGRHNWDPDLTGAALAQHVRAGFGLTTARAPVAIQPPVIEIEPDVLAPQPRPSAPVVWTSPYRPAVDWRAV